MSGSEFALRIALCDVVEKWKRSQEKCKYFEQCRNELAKELQRVKQVNEDLVRENTVLQASLETSASLPNRADNAMADAMRQAKSHSPLVPPSSSDRLRHDEDVKQIYQRLLCEMQRDVTQAALKTPHRVRQQDPAAGLGSTCNKNTLIEDDTGVGANNSVGSELVVGSQPSAGSSSATGTHRKDHPHWNKEQSDTVRKGLSPAGAGVRGDETVSGKQVADRDMRRNRLPAVGQQDPEGVDPDDEKALSHVYAKIIVALTADLNKATQTIVSQKEKLAKLKSKQLRSYFRRLKGEDQQSGNIPNPSASRCHFEHV